MESKTHASTTGSTTSTTWSVAPWFGAKTRQLANRAVSFARSKVRLLGRTYGNRLQEVAQKAGHRLDEAKSSALHRRQELIDKIDAKLDGR